MNRIYSPQNRVGRWVQACFQIAQRAYTRPASYFRSFTHLTCTTATMDFIGEVVSEVIGNNMDRRDEAPMDPPYVQPPWAARWDGEAGRWIFINEATGERSWERPVLEEAGKKPLISPVF